jgi:hypothetical protein
MSQAQNPQCRRGSLSYREICRLWRGTMIVDMQKDSTAPHHPINKQLLPSPFLKSPLLLTSWRGRFELCFCFILHFPDSDLLASYLTIFFLRKTGPQSWLLCPSGSNESLFRITNITWYATANDPQSSPTRTGEWPPRETETGTKMRERGANRDWASQRGGV